MRTAKAISIFAIILLSAVLFAVVGARMKQTATVVIDGGAAAPASPTDTAASQTNVVRPTATPQPTQSLPDVDPDSWELLLVNKNNEIKTAPQVAEIGKTGAYFDSRAVDALNDFISAAKSAGCTVHINLAYVPQSAQEYYFDSKAREIAGSDKITESDADKASRIVSRPGQSDHQTGLAVDITNVYSAPYTNEDIDADTLAWLIDHCAEYGFIQRYPSGKENITGYREPYHFRYVGADAAAYIMEHDLCLEEFLALYK